jgi:hypothetical protein
MVLLCRPDGLLAQALLRRRTERHDGQPTESGAISSRYRTPDLSYPEADLAKGML